MRGYAVQEATEVEESTLQKLEDLKQEYEVEVEQLGTDLAVRIVFRFFLFSFFIVYRQQFMPNLCMTNSSPLPGECCRHTGFR